MKIDYEYKVEVPTERRDKRIATIKVVDKKNNTVKEEVSFKLRRLAKIDSERTIILSTKDKKTLDSKFNEVFARLNFD